MCDFTVSSLPVPKAFALAMEIVKTPLYEGQMHCLMEGVLSSFASLILLYLTEN